MDIELWIEAVGTRPSNIMSSSNCHVNDIKFLIIAALYIKL